MRFKSAVILVVSALLLRSECIAMHRQQTGVPPAHTASVRLDELDFRTFKQALLQPARNRAVQGAVLSIGGVRYAHGIGTHAVSRFTLAVKKRAIGFEAEVGVDDEPKTHAGSVQFVVVGDGRELWRSPTMHTGDAARHVSVDLRGVTTLELVADDAGDGNDSDHADWAEAHILAKSPLDDLYPGGKRPEIRTTAWNRMSPQQRAKGYTMETIAPGVWRLRFGEPEKITPVVLRSTPIKRSIKRPDVRLLNELTMPFPAEAVKFRKTGRGCMVELPMTTDEQIFGFGMNFEVLNATGLRRATRITDSPDTNMGDSHAPVPFYVSTQGYGVYVDTARWAQFYCGDLQRSGVSADAGAKQGLATSTDELYKQRDVNEKRMTVDVPAARGVDVYIFAGPQLADAVQRYVMFSGGGCLPPLWGLGVWYRGSTEFNARDALKLAHDLRESKLPCDVYGLEPGWQSHAYPCSFEWSKERFPDPTAFTADLTSMGFHLNLWEHAFVHPSSPIYDALKSRSGDYLTFGGLVPDFVDPNVRTVFGTHHDKTFLKAGVSGFKLDECDNQPLAPKPWSWPEVASFPSGVDGEQMHSLLPTLYQRTIAETYAHNNLRTYGQVRASHALAAPLPFVLYSDAYDHRNYVRGIVTCGISGVLWQPEVRDCGSIEELYRRIQTAVCSPQTLVNAWYLRNFPWRQIEKDKNNRGELMPGYEKVEETVKQLFELRMSLVPYLYSAFAEYHNQGKPPFRPLVMDYSADPKTWTIDDEYMMGDSLLVAPMFTGEKQRSVYLPEGTWYSFYDGKAYEGKRAHIISAEIEQIPIFVRSGSLIPLAAPLTHIEADTVFDVTVHIFGANPRPFQLVNDDGVSLDYEHGKQSITTLTWDTAKQNVISSTEGDYLKPRYKIVGWKQHTPPQ